jgi:hypothetical protein
MDLKIKTATFRYSRGANTPRGSLSVGTFVRELLGQFTMTTYDEATRTIEIRKATSGEVGASGIQQYNNQAFPWKIVGPVNTPLSGVVSLEARYDDARKTFVLTLPAELPPARTRKTKPMKKPLDGEAKPVAALRQEVDASAALKERALKARAELVTALGKLDGTLYAVDKATGQEVQIIPSSIRMVARMRVVKVEEVEL